MADTAAACGISLQFYNDIEHGRNRPRAEVLIRFCQMYGYNPYEALEEFEAMPKETIDFLHRSALLVPR